MSYEYMSGMGLGKNGAETSSAGSTKTVDAVPTGTPSSSQQDASFVASESQGILAQLNPLIARARTGEAGALEALRSAISHSDFAEDWVPACAAGTPGLSQEFCTAVRTAQSLASGQAPASGQTPASSSSEDENGESNTGLYIGLGVGAGVLVLLGIYAMSKK